MTAWVEKNSHTVTYKHAPSIVCQRGKLFASVQSMGALEQIFITPAPTNERCLDSIFVLGMVFVALFNKNT